MSSTENKAKTSYSEIPSTEQKGNECYVCQKNLEGAFKTKKTCYFCSNTVCQECSRRRWQNPSNKEEFQRICDYCHQSMLYSKIMEKYLIKKQNREEIAENLDLQYQQTQKNLQEKQKEYEECINTMDSKVKEMEEQEVAIKSEIDEINSQIEEIDQYNSTLNTQYERTNKEVKDTQDKIKQSKIDYNNLQNDVSDLDKEIKDLQEQIQKLTEYYQAIELKIQTLNNTPSTVIEHNFQALRDEPKNEKHKTSLRKKMKKTSNHDIFYTQSYIGESTLDQSILKSTVERKKRKDKVKMKADKCSMCKVQ